MKRAASAADIVGARALVAHAKNDSARSFYERFDFLSCSAYLYTSEL
jgi:hypothetical protein